MPKCYNIVLWCSEYPVIKATNYPIQDALAVAIKIFEQNKSVVRDSVADRPDIVPNRFFIADHLSGKKPVKFSKDDQNKVDDLINYLKQSLFLQTLTDGKSDKFLQNIVTLISAETVSNRDLGLLAWAPKLADDFRKKESVKLVSAQFENRSKFVGKIKDKINLNFTLIESRYIASMDCTAVYGHDDHGNLFFYWAKDSKKIVQAGNISGRIKAHNRDRFRGGACVTNLNYVKVIK